TYVPLRLRTAFSFLEGASRAEEFCGAVKRLGVAAFAVTDRDGVQGMAQAHLAAKETGARLIVGSEVTVAGGATIVLPAETRGGYANLCRLVTKGRRRCEKGRSEVFWDEVCAHAPGLVALWPGGDEVALPKLREAFGGALFALASRHRVAEERDAERR